MKRYSIFLISIVLTGVELYGQVTLLTTAERTGYTSTANYGEVMTFVDQLKKSSPLIRVEKIATSVEGRDVPLLVIGNPMPLKPEDLQNDSRIVVYIQANIHAGEVEGKEATLMYARDLLKDKDPLILKDVVILICPLFNPDGNEKISTMNRTNQNGPVNGVGVRYNGQYLDLNRDAMKAESPEVRGVLTNVFNRWDPAVFMDCHTTDGSYHVEPVTFTWMVNPNGNRSLINYMRDKMMPDISETLSDKYKIENCFYGEFFDMMDPEKGWVLDASEPRYMSNYFGIRNRLGILNENYVYADFKSRVVGCYFLIHSLIDYASLHKTEIKELLQRIDKETISRGSAPSVTDSFAIEYKVRPAPFEVTVKTYEAEEVKLPGGRTSYRRTDRQKNVTIPYYIDYYPTVGVKFPFAYLITIKDQEVLDLLKIHGVRIEKLANDSEIEVERFEISALKGSERLNQGHYTNTVKGRFVEETIDFPAGTIIVRTAQPLANVAAYLLEPQSNDGLMTWNFFDRYLVPQWGAEYYPWPVYRVMKSININTIPVM
jgi:murein tripeptide amidase MpaA